MSTADETRFAVIALAGRPNVGKSTLLNAAVGEPLAITSPKPQSTRGSVVGVRTDGPVQLVFIDPPGLLVPTSLLQQLMLNQAVDALRQADGVLYLHPADEGEPPLLDALLPAQIAVTVPTLTVLTKADTAPAGGAAPGRLAVSAVTGQGLDALLTWCRARARPGEFRYEPDDVSTQPVRFFVEEYVREAAFGLLHQELPYALAAQVDEFREEEDPVYIRATAFVERASQKRMVIGSGGRTIKALGERARERTEDLLGRRVYLDLWVKVLPRWRRSEAALRHLGFPVPTENSP